jgi:hypothetical protein
MIVDGMGELGEGFLNDPLLDPASVGLNEYDFDDMDADAASIFKLMPDLRKLF